MKHTILMSLCGVALLAGCQTEQPKMNCNLAHGSYAVTYTPVAGIAPAATGSRCDLENDVVGVQKYTDDEGRGRVYIVPLEIGVNNFYGYSYPPPIGGSDMAIGLMNSAKPGDDEICRIDSFEAASSQENEAAGGTLKHTFSNMEFIVRPDVPGTIMKYRVTITDSDEGCSGTYDAVGMFPTVSCGDPATGAPVDENCAHADHVYSGLALNPAFDVMCKETPSYSYVADVYYGGAPAFVSFYNQMLGLCVPRDPANLFCPDSGCDWQPEH